MNKRSPILHTTMNNNKISDRLDTFHCQYLPEMGTSYISAFWVSIAVSLIASPLSIILNALVIIAFKQRRKLQRLSNILLSSIALADLLTGVISIPGAVTVSLLAANQGSLEHLCLTKAVVMNFKACFVFSSLYHLTMVAWERYVAIQKWMDYKVIVTRHRLKTLAIFAWLLAIFTTLPVFLMAMAGVDVKVQKIWIMILNIFGAVNVVLIVYFYVMVYFAVLKRKASKIKQVTALVQAELESKTAKTTSLITAAALILSIVLGGILMNLTVGFQAFRSSLHIYISGALFQLNSVLNPLLYCYRDRRFRNAVLELSRKRKFQNVQPTEVAVRFSRQKYHFGSLQNIQGEGQRELKSVGKRTRPTRSSSLGETIDFGDLIILKRSMSAPSLLITDSSKLNCVQLEQTCSFVTTAAIHAERNECHQQKIICISPGEDMKMPQCSVH